MNIYVDKTHYRIDVRRAPMIEAIATYDVELDRYLLQLTNHHLISDHTTFQMIIQEIGLIQEGREADLPEPLSFRNFVAQACLGVSQKEHEDFFTQMLGGVEEPSVPFGLMNVTGDGSDIEEVQQHLPEELALALRRQAQRYGVSAASLFHLAWGLVVAKTSNLQDVVFGTVLFGRMQGGDGSERALGLFINTLPVRIVLRDQSVEQALRKTHEALSELMHHEHASLALAQRCSALPGGVPLFSTLLNYRYSDPRADSNVRAAWDGMEILGGEERTNYPVTFSVDDRGEGFSLDVQVSPVLDANRICDYVIETLYGLVKAMINTPTQRVLELSLLSDAETHRILREWNDTMVDYGESSCIHSLFEAQVERTPQAIALICPTADQFVQILTYAQLNSKANQLAHTLRGMGVGPDVVVGIAVERSVEMVVGLLGILKAGGAYVPLDPEYPEDRLSYMMADSGIRLLLTQTWLQKTLSIPADVKALYLDQAEIWQQSDTSNLPLIASPQNLAYVIYTSGSTGKPKGVAIAHYSSFMLLNWAKSVYGPEDLQGVFAATSICFDLSVWELFTPLSWGGSVVLAENVLSLPHHSARDKVSLINTVPTAITVLFRNHQIPANVHTINLAGEALKQDLVEELYAEGIERIFDLYGPSEDTTYSTGVLRVMGEEASIGRPIANTQTYILTGDLQSVPVRASGELYIAGAGLARGYYSKPSLTAERFVPDPYGKIGGGRLYRTGDLARYRSDGNIEYLGRIDHQVKIRGFRIELGEIESQLNVQAEVKEAVVIAQQVGDIGGQQLVAYVVPNGNEPIDADVQNAFSGGVKAQLQAVLPEYMVPNQYVLLDKLPLMPNGKLDRKALPKVDGSAFTREYQAPQTELEQQLASIWQKVLGIERVGLNDNFFELGGHSLLVTRLSTLVNTITSRDIPLRSLFENPVLREFCKVVEQSSISLTKEGMEDIESLMKELTEI